MPPPPPEPSPFRDKHSYLPSHRQRAVPTSSGLQMPSGFNPQNAEFQGPRPTTPYQQGPPSEQPAPPSQPSAAEPQAPAFPAQPAPPPASSVTTPYDFMMNPEQPKQHLTLPGKNASLPVRALLVVGSLLALFIILIIVKGLFGGSSNLVPLVSVAQDQQELVHLTSNALKQPGISAATQNFAATTQLSVTSAQAALIKYLAANGQKITPKIIVRKVSLTTDKQLQAAIAATTYDQTFQQIMQAKLDTYVSDLKQAYSQTKGQNGRALLNNDYKQAQLLLLQFSQANQ